MASFPPDQNQFPPTPDPQPNEEPRLLTRREVVEPPPRERPHITIPKLPNLKLPSLRAQRAALFTRVRSPWPKRIARTLVTALACLLIVALAITLYLRHTLNASLPQLDGTLRVTGLTQAVTVTRDPQSVPSITAASLDDLLFAQGFTTAQDRLWQMDALRRHAAGELAEILGPGLVEHDRRQRILQLRAAADAAVAAMSPAQLHQLEAYARGVNAAIDNVKTLPVEFHLLSYAPAPWQPRDSVLVLLAMYQDLATTFPHKLTREALTQHLPAELASDLYPVGSFRDRPPSQPRHDLTEPVEAIEQIPLDSTQSSLTTPADLLRIDEAMKSRGCDGCISGSNNWAVSAAHSASGAPLLSNDMHLALSAPDIWYEAALHTTDHVLDVTGFTLPGIPLVVVGRNAHVAWSFTNLGADVQDIYIEHLRGTGKDTEYQRADGTWQPVAHHTELIRVRMSTNRTIDVQTTTHPLGTKTLNTPIISPLYPSEHRALSLAWTVYDPAALQPNFLSINTAQSGAELVASFASFGGPSLNLIYADDQKHIGYHALGMIPVRGPATQRPREIPSIGMPTNGPELEGPAPEESEPEASVDAPSPFTLAAYTPGFRPHLLQAAFVPARRRRRVQREEPAPRVRQRREPHARTEAPIRTRPEVEVEPTPTTAIVPAQRPTTNYTVGSPLFNLPVDALNPAAAWSGYVPYGELPSIVDPTDGVLATANARIVPDNYPYYLADEWVDAYRVERIHNILDGRTGLTPADMLRTQLDTYSALDHFLAERLAYAIDHASSDGLGKDTDQLHAAADILRRWDGNMAVDSPAAAILSAFRRGAKAAILVPQILRHDHLKPTDRKAEELAALYNWNEANTALETLINHQPARWLPPGFHTWNDFLASLLAECLKDSDAPRDLTRWQYGSTHTIRIDHPVLGSHGFLDTLLGIHAGSGARPIGGDGSTVRAVGPSFGPSERFTADLSSTDATTANLTTGQSGNPRSPNYFDHFLPWLNGATFALPLYNATTTHTLTLQP